MKEVYDFLVRLEDMCNHSQHRSVTIEHKHIYDMKKMIEDIPDTIKMLREDKERLQTENTKLKQQLQAHKDKEDKIREYLSNTEFEERTAYDKSFCEGVYNTKEKVLKILNEGE